MCFTVETMPEHMELVTPTVALRNRRLQLAANTFSALRIAAAPAVFGWIVAHRKYRSWGLTGAMGVLDATDKLDGWLGQDDPLGRKLDKIGDKALSHAVLAGIAVREALNGNVRYARNIAANQLGLIARDVATSSMCSEVKAQKLGKAKTAWLDGVELYAVSPLSEGQDALVETGLMGGNLLSIASGVELFQKQRALKASMASADTNVVPLSRNAPVGTGTTGPSELPPAAPHSWH